MRQLNIVLIVLSVLLASCQLLPQKKTQSESFKGAETFAGTNSLLVKRVIDGEKSQPLPNLSVSGSSNTVTVSTSPLAFGSTGHLTRPPYHEELNMDTASAQSAISKQESQSKYSVSLPLGIGLLLSAAGLTAIVFAVRYGLKAARQGSAAASAVLDAADSAMANRIKSWRAKSEALQSSAATTTDPTQIADALRQIASLQSEIAEHEKERGKLAVKAAL